jgi:uncharacterized lipoprotein
MKKTSYALVVPALILSALLVSGCGAFRSKKDWDRAQQEAPLEIPPGLDTPSTSAALVIPEVGSGAAAANAAATNAAPVSDGFVLADDVETAYKRIGEQLSQGDLGNVIAHDDTNHTYQIAAKPGRPEARPGLFRRMFGGGKDNQDAKDAPASAQGASHTVVLTVNPSGTGSEIRAQGDADGVRRVVDSLKSRMGSK